MLLFLFFASLFGLAPPEPAPSPLERRVAVVLPEGWALPELARWASFAKRQGIEVRVGAAPEPETGWETFRLAAPPLPEDFRRRLAANGSGAR